MFDAFQNWNDEAAAVAQVAFNLLLQSTVLIVVGLTAAWLLKGRGSAIRSAIYRATLVAVLICPVASMMLSMFGVSGWTVQLPGTTTSAMVPPSQQQELTAASVAFPIASLTTPTAEPDSNFDPKPNFQLTHSESGQSWVQPTSVLNQGAHASNSPVNTSPYTTNTLLNAAYAWVVIAWLVGAFVLLARLGFAYFTLNCIRHNSIVAEAPTKAVNQSLASIIKVRAPDVFRNPRVASPCLCGISHPAILLPTELQHRYLLEKAITHELAHLRRRDNIWNLIQRIAIAGLFFQPLLWRLVYRLETTAEEVCDDVVVDLCHDRSGYARQLVGLAESNLLLPNMAGLGMFNGKSILGHRVARILDTTRQLTTRVSGKHVGAISMIAITFTLLGGLIGTSKTLKSEFSASPPAIETNHVATNDEPADVLLSGTVLDLAGNPIEGAQISVFSHPYNRFGGLWDIAKTKSDKMGRYEISYPKRKGRDTDYYYLAASATNFGPVGRKLAIHQNATHDFSMAETKEFSFQAVDLDGNPVLNAQLKVHGVSSNGSDVPLTQDLQTVIKSDAQGRFKLSQFSPGQSIEVGVYGKGLQMTARLTLEDERDHLAKGNSHRLNRHRHFFLGESIICGESIPLKVVDSDDNPINESIRVNKYWGPISSNTSIKGPDLWPRNFYRNENRLIRFESEDGKSGALELIGLSLVDTTKAHVVQLSPYGTFHVRLVDANGHPVSGRIGFEHESSAEPIGYPGSMAVKNGEFKWSKTPTNVRFKVLFWNDADQNARESSGLIVFDSIELAPYEHLDLGTVDIGKLNKQLSETATMAHEFSGNVSDSANRPISNASVSFNTWEFYPKFNRQTLATVRTDSDGNFQLEINQESSATGYAQSAIVVKADGFGNLEIPREKLGESPLKLRLASENIIRGRIVDLDGNPVIGAEVQALSANAIGTELANRWLEKLAEAKSYSETEDMIWHVGNPNLSLPSGGCNGKMVTDENGIFEYRGMPLDSIVEFRILHPAITTHLFEVLNRSMKSVKSDPRYEVFGDQATIITQPCRPIAGTIVDSKTGDPVSGAKVNCREMGISHTVHGTSAAPQTQTDANGKFKLLGMPKSPGNRLMVYPPVGEPYLIKEVNKIPETEGFETATIVVKLDRGVWISGQVIDKATGKGVKSTLRYFPLTDNPHFRAAKDFQTTDEHDHYTFFDNYQTNDEGNFHVVGLPGKAILGATVDNQDYRTGVGYDEIMTNWGQSYSENRIKAAAEAGIDLSKEKFLNINARYSFNNSHGSTFIAIEPAEDTGLKLNEPIRLDPGTEIVIKVVDADRNPIERFSVSKFNGFWGKKEFTDGTATLTRMGEDEVRWIAIKSADGLLGVYAKVSGNANQQTDKTITLYPRAKIHGRLVDKQGNPLAGYPLRTSSCDATTDENGEFLFEGLITGDTDIDLRINRPEPKPGELRPLDLGEFTQASFNKTLTPGQTTELGDVAVDPKDYWLISG